MLLIFAWALVIIMNGASLDDITQAAIILMEISVMEHTRHPSPLIGPGDTALASDWLMVTSAQELSETDGQCHRSWANDRGGNIRQQKFLYLFGKDFEFQSQA